MWRGLLPLLVVVAAQGCLDPDKYVEEPDGAITDSGVTPGLDAARFDTGGPAPTLDTGFPQVDMAPQVDMGEPGDGTIEVDQEIIEEDMAVIEEDATPPPPTECQVEFVVQVPAGTDAVYVAGDMTDWEPGVEQLNLSGTEARATLTLPQGPTNYKYTRGSWETVEKTGECGEQDNRPQTIRCGPDGIAPPVIDQVANWADGC